MELNRMGADIEIDGSMVRVRGVPALRGSVVHALNLRAGAALILAGLAAQGETRIEDFVHIARGYEAIEGKLRSLGAKVRLESYSASAPLVLERSGFA
jgi:UDP-N-acetylglucosamine 1-carboxyvinyltransferase